MTDRVALVTGAASGIGAAVATALVDAGYRVAGLDRAPVTAPGVLALEGDVTAPSRAATAVARAEEALGPLTALVCCAGVLRTGPVLGTTDADWNACLDVNATGVFTVCRAAGAGMAARGHGAIVTVASTAAGGPRAGMAAYAASKAAAAAFTRSFGLELAEHGVRANVVCPGSTDTPMLRDMVGDAGYDGLVAGVPEQFKVGIPLGRVAAPDDVAGAVLYLLSDAARHVTLQTLYVDGGASLGP